MELKTSSDNVTSKLTSKENSGASSKDEQYRRPWQPNNSDLKQVDSDNEILID